MSSLLLSVLQFIVILCGKRAVSSFIVDIRLAWASYEDKEFVSMCDEQYNSMVMNQTDYENDREA